MGFAYKTKLLDVKSKSRKTISYRTGRYRRNIPFWRLKQYRNRAKSYRPKYQCTGLFRLFRRISELFGGIFVSDRYKYNWVFLKKLDTYSNLQVTATSDHHWSINLLDRQQHHLLLRFSHLDLLFSHCNHSLLPLLSPCFVCSTCWNSFSTFWRSFLYLEERADVIFKSK